MAAREERGPAAPGGGGAAGGAAAAGGGGGGGAARRHPGETMVDEASFAEVWPDVDGPDDVDDEEHRQAFPERFIWSCCGRPGDAEGCEPRSSGKRVREADGGEASAPGPEILQRRHPGEMMVDEASFAEVWPDVDCPDDVDDEEHRQAFPERFIWSCCGRPGDAEGCEKETVGQAALRIYGRMASAIMAGGAGLGLSPGEPVELSSASDSSASEGQPWETVPEMVVLSSSPEEESISTGRDSGGDDGKSGSPRRASGDGDISDGCN